MLQRSVGIVLFCFCALASAADLAPEVLLWPNGAPGSEGLTQAEKLEATSDGPATRVSSIHKPSVYTYLPSKEKATGAAMIIAPGGGHRFLSMSQEGHNLGKWLSDVGIAAFVLKYRLAREEGSKYTIEGHALKDTQRAIRLVRSRASEWNIQPDRIGVIGFSAGGELALLAALKAEAGDPAATDPIEQQGSRPDFAVLIYPGIRQQLQMEIPSNLPPMFMAAAFDDRGPAAQLGELYVKLVKANVPSELHIYSRGGHGFGVRQRPMPITGWPARMKDWMEDRGLLARP